MPRSWLFPLLTIALGGLTACGGDDAPELVLSPDGEIGHTLARSQGCAGCHGSSGEGGVGPAFAGLWGSEVELDDGTVVIADEAYIRESITTPDAKIVAGVKVTMPSNSLDDDEIDALIAYIRDLGTPAGSDAALSPLALEGEAVSQSKGCAGCHGAAGEGGIAGPLRGLWGSEVILDDGSTVVADEAYIVESIVDPDALRPAGNDVPMPTMSLTDDEVEALVAYIRELGDGEEAA